MNKKLSYILSSLLATCAMLCFLFTSCKNGNEAHEQKQTQTQDTSDTSPLVPKYYKRYTGFINNEPVVLSFFSLGSERTATRMPFISGSYHYKNKSQILQLSTMTTSGDSIIFTEFWGTDPREYGNPAEWIVVIKGNTIQGRWIDEEVTLSYPIDLKEDYSGGGYMLNVSYKEDSSTFHLKGHKASVYVRMALLSPGDQMTKEDAGFLEQTLIHLIGGDTIQGKNMDELYKNICRYYFHDSDKIKSLPMDTTLSDEEFDEKYGNDIELWQTCLYNNNGMLGFEFGWYNERGCAQGIGWNNMASIDMKEKKLLHLADVMTPDTAAISALLEKEALKYKSMTEHNKLKYRVRPTDNFIISDRGITFYYDIDDHEELFLPYSKLTTLLKPEFRKRMGL